MNKTINIIKSSIAVLVIMFYSASTLNAEETKWISIGNLQNWYSAAGCEIELGRTGQISDQQDGLRWPSFFPVQDNQAAKAMWLGATSFYDPIAEKTFDNKVVHVGPRFIDIDNETIPLNFKLYGKYDHSRVFVDGVSATNMTYFDEVNEIDESIPGERMLVNEVQTSMGIKMIRKIHAFTNPDHQDYHLFEYEYINNGCFNSDCSEYYEQTIEGFMAYFQFRYAVSREGMVYDGNWLPQSAAWGHNTMNETIGHRPNSPNSSFDQFYDDGEIIRAVFSWHGYHSGTGFDNIGGPNDPGDGLLGASQFAGVVTIHADKSASNHSNDINQPSTSWYMLSDDPLTDAGSDQYNSSRMIEEYDYMTQGHPDQSMAQQVGTGNANQFSPGGASNPGGTSQGIGYGPYTLAIGDTIRIVVAEAVSGLSREMAYKVGQNWKTNSHTDDFPTGTSNIQKYLMDNYSRSSSGKNGYKNEWVFTGIDSLINVFKNARENYKSNFNIVEPPRPPAEFVVNSGGDRIALSWSSDAEDWANFSHYQVTRLKFRPDTTLFKYDLDAGLIIPIDESIISVWTFDKGITEFDDLTATRGFDYFYYIEVFDDGSTNDGSPLVSSRFLTRSNSAANLKRPPGSLDQVRIVPNPFNIAARDFQYGVSAEGRLMFYNIPGECTIRIYTERGDLIKTITHTDGSGDEEWKSITSSRQVVTSGLYIAQIETPSGESTIQKFMIIR